MDWRAKARIQRALSAVPGGHHLNWLLQRHVTRGYPRRGAQVDEIVASADRHLEAVREVPRPLEDLRFFEFGAGWDLARPLALAGRGVRHQHLVDIRPLVRPWLVREMWSELQARGLELPDPPADGGLDELLAPLGITYAAPADARRTGLPDGAIDVVTSTNTLEHVPADDIASIMREVRRVLAADGICSFAVDYHDHYADADASIGPHNHLRFSEDEWRCWNCALQFQNRLRHSQYVELFGAAGFDVEVVDVERVEVPADLEVAAAFRELPADDLVATYGWFRLRHPADP